MEIEGGISPKSIVASGTGLFAAQNMMYRHTITIYNKTGKLLAKVKDGVDLRQFGYTEYPSDTYLGAPVEAVFSHKGKYLWVSNYEMKGTGFNNPGCDACNGNGYDPGFVYKVNTSTFKIENVIKVGAVPKFMAISEDEKKLLVSNWSSGDISVIDLTIEKEVQKIAVGSHPRGIDITKDGKKAFVTVMGSTKIAEIDLTTYKVKYITNIGNSPRHVVLSDDDSLLYVAVNSSNTVVKYEICSGEKEICRTNSGPRTMILSPSQQYLYVVNYFDNTFTKIQTDSMKIVEVVETGNHPIGITANWEDAEIWVACYTGKIEIFKDFHLAKLNEESKNDWSTYFADFLPYLELQNSDSVKSSPDTSRKIVKPDYQTDDIVLKNDSKDENKKEDYQPRINATSVSKVDKSKIPMKSNEAGCTYHIIVGSFGVYENAVNFRKEMEKKGFPAQLLDSNKGLTYVSVQCFDSREKANAGINGVEEKTGVRGWVLRR